MLEITFSKVLVVVGATTIAVGKSGVPPLAHTFGRQVGRFVGLLQAGKSKLEDLSENNQEMRQMGEELNREIRKLDSVKTELAMAASATRPGGMGGVLRKSMFSRGVGLSGGDDDGQKRTAQVGSIKPLNQVNPPPVSPLTPPSTNRATIGAVVEEEWSNNNMSFTSVGETSNTSSEMHGMKSGSDLLADILREGLIHDHYDGVVAKHEREQAKERTKKA